MPLYQYRALDQQGNRRKGVIDASHLSQAKQTLREQGLMVTQVALHRKGSKGELSGDGLMTFTMQLSQLTEAGVPLYESLLALEEQSRQEGYHALILSLCEQIKAGQSLSEVMASYPHSFDKLYTGMVRAGESSGSLPLVLQRLSHFLGRRQKLKKQIGTAMVYPAILSIFALLVMVLLMTFVIPSIEGIFTPEQLNSFSAAVLAVSYQFRTWWWLYLPAVVGLGGMVFFWMRSPRGKVWRETTFLRFPIVGTLMQQAATARFCRTMSTLLAGGVTMVEALHISRTVMGNLLMEEEMKRCESRIIEGSRLSASLGHCKWIPQLVTRMVAVGEESGTITMMFSRLADMYEDEVEKTIARLLAMVQPVILIVMGAVIFGVLMAMLLPLAEFANLGS